MDWHHEKELNKKAIAILRVSSKQQEDNTSLTSQEKEIKAYCIEFGLAIVDDGVFRISESARDTDNRKKYKEAIRFALKKRIRHVIFYMNDRESRNLTDLENNEKLVKQDKIIIHHVQDRKVFHKESSVSDILVRNFTGIINKDYSLRLAVKVNRGTLAKAEMGQYPASKPPLGYKTQRKVDDDGREASRGIAYIIIDPNRSRVKQVQREFELRAQGLSLDKIRDQIIAEGFIPKGKPYRRTTVEQRLKNKFYWGYFDWKGIEYQGKHPLIISQDILRRVKRSFEEQQFKSGPAGRTSLFGNWMQCGTAECGRMIVFDPKKKKIKSTGEIKVFPYYRCSNSRRVHSTLTGLYINENEILDRLKPAITESSITDDFAQAIRLTMRVVHEQAKGATRSKMAEYRTEIKNLEGKEDEVYEHFTAGILDKPNYKRQIQKIRDEKDRYTDLLELASLAITDAVYDSLDRLLELLISSKSLVKTAHPHELVAHLKKVCSNPILMPASEPSGERVSVGYSYLKPVADVVALKAVEGDSEEWSG